LLIKSVLKSLYFLGILAEIAIRVPHERRRRRIRMAVDCVDGSERALVGLLSMGMFFIPAVYALTPWLNWADYRLSLEVKGRVGRLGAAILAFALWLFWRSHADLGRNWSPSLQLREEHHLVTEGVYRTIRHPMYASQWLWSVAQPLLLQNWIAGWVGLLLFLPLYVLRVPREEQMMLAQFGAAYRAYTSRTGRILPRLEGWGA
jgi:protein-S-isoprenylcysteine O-methyltransferase Ste14